MNTSEDRISRSAEAGSSGRITTPAFLRAVLDHAPDLITVADERGRVVYSTPAASELLGYEPSERIGRSIFELMDPEDAPHQRELFDQLLQEPGAAAAAEFRVRHRNGSTRVLQARARNLLDDPQVSGLLFYLRDVTAQREAERQRDATRDLLDRVISHVPVALYLVGPDGTIELSEGRALEGIGLRPGEVVGQNIFQLELVSDASAALIRRALAGESVEGDFVAGELVLHTVLAPMRAPDGTVTGALGVSFDVTERERQTRTAAFRARLLDEVGEAVIAIDLDGRVTYWNRAAEELYGWSQEEALGRDVLDLTVPEGEADSAGEIIETVQAGQAWSGEYTLRRKDGSCFPAHVTAVPLMEEGQGVGIIGVSRDIRDWKALEEQLVQAQKMEAVGRLAGGIAHDFNNILTAIGGYAGMAAERSDDAQVAADIAEVVEATERARALVDKLLTFSRRSQGLPRAVDVNGLIGRMAAMLRRTLGEDIRLELSLQEDLWPARAVAEQLEQALVNLALNARDAMPQGGLLSLRTDRVALDPRRARRVAEALKPGDYVRITVMDTGTGIESAIQDRIFDPFFTTKGVGKGTGLGLSMVFGALARLGGAITVESEPGDGTRFVLYLPRADAPSNEVPAAAVGDDARASGDDPTILLVEDEEAVRALARRVLVRDGYGVLEASTGVGAERLMATAERAPDLLLTDVIMPEMGGAALADRLRDRWPDLRVLYMSGYTADELASRGIDEREENFLPKPFSPAQLSAAVRAVLGQ